MSHDDCRGLESPDTIDPAESPVIASPDRQTTPIGVDLGESPLYTVSPTDPARAIEISAAVHSELGRLRDRTTRLRESAFDHETIAAYVAERRETIVGRIDAAAREVCADAAQYDAPVIVTEHFHFEADLWAWLTDPHARLGTAWLLPTAHQRLRSIAADRGIETATVPVAYSSQACHACGVLGDRDTAFRCPNPACHVETIDADRNAAVVLAKRYGPGRRCAYRPERPAHDGQ